MPEILFRSDHVEVRRIAVGDGRHQVVTFESYHDEPGFGRIGFGETFFTREGFTGIHVLSSGNDWYQYPEIGEVLAVIRAAVNGAERVLAYGSSMGGYAALRFADAIGATDVLSLSPQYSIDPRVVKADRRWWWDQRRITFLPEHNGALACRANIVIAFDPTIALDALHAERIGRDVKVTMLRLDHAGHPVTTVLAELHLLQKMALSFLAGAADPAAIRAEFEARREESSMWLVEYGSRLPGGDRLKARDIAARAVDMSPGNAAIKHQYGMRLHDLGQYDEAVAAHEEAVAISPHPIFVLSLSRALFFAGRHAEALEQVLRAQRERPYDDFYFHSSARIRLAMGDRIGAWRDAREAFRLAKRPRTYWDLARYGFHRAFG
ncbi:hypothetical protein [Sphingomonas sp.]|uniref:tetratricopeptide repeat protein n=1 Tax=Sphingomonas sp. TaxID=28214 RepID=UPI000DB38A19|nr:hypothetical protein [Sphingomonas sp.]PZU08641.1 MAG: hypothetical protein DI605_11875 [Sphingomonas sp.]